MLKSKWIASPKTCFVFKSEDIVLGYLLAHAWNSQIPPKLFEELPNECAGSVLYLHDLATAENARGLGVGRKLIAALIKSAQSLGFQQILLVAVQKSEQYWAKYGFSEVPDIAICTSYGDDAKLMGYTITDKQ